VSELSLRIERESGTGSRAESSPIRPAPRHGDLPLSYSQQRMWFLEQLAPGNAAFHIPLGMRLRGRLGPAALAGTFREVARRHEILRTTFPVRDGLPVQCVGPAMDVPLPLVDLSGLGAAREPEAWRIAAEHARRLFDLAAGPLVRTLLLRLEEQDHVLVCVMHHAVSDGWSRGVLTREVSALYGALLEGRPSPLPELPIQYADYAVWQRQWLRESSESGLAYWREHLAGAPPVHRLPTDRPRPPVQTYAGAREPVRLSPALSERLNALSRQAGSTLFMTLLAAFFALLRRYTDQDDHVAGTSVAGRTRPEIESLIGFFVNMLPLRADTSGDPAFADLLKQMREVTLEAFARQDLPFEAMVEALQPERSLSYPPLFQVVLTLQNAPVSELALPGLTLSFPQVEQVAAKYDLLLDLWEGGEGGAGALELNADLFDGATGRRIVRHFESLLAGAVAAPERRLSELPLLDEAERLQAVAEPNRSEADYSRDRCVHELIERQAAESPDAVAVICGEESLTCRELDRRANQVARHLASLGVGPGDLVGLCLDHSLEEVIGLLGVLKAGAGYVPLDPGHPPRRLLHALADAGARVALTQERLAPRLLETGLALVRLDADAPAIPREDATLPARRATPRDVAYVIYTSGSTGEPKGVAIQHQALVNYVEWASAAYLRGESAGFPLYSSLAFDLTVTSIFMALVTGNPLIVFRGEDGEPPLRAILDDGRVGVLKLTPSHLTLIKDQDNRRSAVRRLVVGGEALATRLAREVHDSFGGRVEIYNEYGPTEATVGCMIHRFDPVAAERPFVPIGRPAANTQVYVLDLWLNPVPENVVGELHVAGDGLALGYLNRPELTAGRFLPSPFVPGRRMYRTGDLARRLPGGEVDFVGRADGQVKLRGFRIETGEIEAVLGEHPAVRDCAVLLREDAPGDRRLVAYLVAKGETPSTSELRRFLEERLPAFMLPAAFISLETMPVTGNGKVDRHALPAPDGGRPELEAAYTAPETEMEQAIAGIWKGVLRLPEIGLYDNFFHLGGQSILATQVIQRINQRFRVNLPIRAIFGESTVAGLSVLVEETLIERLEAEP
jgi:amino acid adenylation domain-containing protein